MNLFKRTIALNTVVLLLSLLTSHGVFADSAKGPRAVIQESTDRVLELVERQKQESDSQATPEMAAELLRVLEPVVDFDSIARGVMGKHRQAASTQQVEEFVEVFKDSLSQLYMRSFQSLEVKAVEVMELPKDFDPQTAFKATVQMQATIDSGENFGISYSMRKDDNDQWVVRNIIVDGINLGLTYMNQFDGAVKRHGSIDKAIASWPEEMESETFDSQGAQS